MERSQSNFQLNQNSASRGAITTSEYCNIFLLYPIQAQYIILPIKLMLIYVNGTMAYTLLVSAHTLQLQIFAPQKHQSCLIEVTAKLLSSSKKMILHLSLQRIAMTINMF